MKRWLMLAAALMMGAVSISCVCRQQNRVTHAKPVTVEKKIIIYQVDSDSAQIYELEQEGVRTIIQVTTHQGDERIEKIMMVTTEDLEAGEIMLDTLMVMEIDEDNIKMMKGDEVTYIIKDGEVVVGDSTELHDLESIMLGLDEDLHIIEEEEHKVIIIKSETVEEEPQEEIPEQE